MDKKKIGNLISTLRKEKGMTQKDLAERLHVSDRTVSKWERGAGVPDASLMIGLSDILGITVNELLTGERITDRNYMPEAKEEIKEAAAVILKHMKSRQKALRNKVIAIVLLIALLGCGVGLAIEKLGENRILFPPRINCELLQRDIDFEATLFVDRNNSGVYDYVCAYDMDRYGNVRVIDNKVWQSYTDLIPSEVYEGLKKTCPGNLTTVDIIENGYLVCSYEDYNNTIITETDSSLNPVFRYELSTEESTSWRAFLADEVLYALSYNGEEDRVYVTSVNKKTGQEKFNSFVYRDFVPDAGEDYSMGQILFDKDHLWIRDDILYFAETYYGRPSFAVLGAYDLAKSKAVYFETIEHAEVIMVHRDPDKGQVSVVINPMGYQPLELCTLDDKTMEIINVTKLELPNEYLTRKDSVYEADVYSLWKADIDQDRVAIMFGDIIDRNKMDDGLSTSIMVVYDRISGDTIWRGRFTMDAEYEISSFNIA